MPERYLAGCDVYVNIRNDNYPKIADISCKGCGVLDTLLINNSEGMKEIPDQLRKICPRLDKFAYRSWFW